MSKRLTQSEFEEKFYSIYDASEWSVVGNYINNRTKIEIKHNKCGNSIFMSWTNLSNMKCNCKHCNPNKDTSNVIVGVNDIATTNKEMYDLLLDKSDGNKYREHSNKYVYFKCPNCGAVHYKMINTVSGNGLCCECMSDGVSYPEKYFICLLNQLNIEYEYQFEPEWIKPMRYDFEFVYDGVKHIVEIDGNLGHGNFSYDKISKADSLKRDLYKDDKAIENGYIITRIDAAYKDVNIRNTYLQNSILNSAISTIFDLSYIDFNKCNEYAIINYCNRISELWNNGIRGYENIRKYIPVSRTTIRRYLREASNIGLIHESYDEILKINRPYSNKQLQVSKGTSVKCNETGEIFPSISEASRAYRQYGCSNLLRYFCKGGKFCGHLPDGTPLTWTRV